MVHVSNVWLTGRRALLLCVQYSCSTYGSMEPYSTSSSTRARVAGCSVVDIHGVPDRLPASCLWNVANGEWNVD